MNHTKSPIIVHMTKHCHVTIFNSVFFPLRNKTLHATKHREIFWLKANKHCTIK